MKIIIGLGNPGEHYKNSRHNLGFVIVDQIAQQHNLSWKENKKFKSDIAEGDNFILVKPQTFMNSSGQAVAAILRYYKLIPTSLFGIKKDADLTSVLTVIHDELDLPFGTYKISNNSSSAGHRGVQSIIDHLKTKSFRRLRIGIDQPNRRQMPSDKFVLQNFSATEKQTLEKVIAELLSRQLLP